MQSIIRWLCAGLLALSTVSVAGDKPWDVRDSVELTYYVYDDGSGGQGSMYADNAKVVASPDGSHFFVQTMRGDLDRDLIVNELVVYASASITSALKDGNVAPAPVARHRAESRDYGPLGPLGIRVPQWSADSQSIYFIEADAEARTGLRRLDVRSGEKRWLTPPDGYVDEFRLDGEWVIYRERTGEKTLWEEAPLPYPVNYVDSEYFKRGLSWSIPTYQNWLLGPDGVARKFGHPERGHFGRTLGLVSPDGHWLVVRKTLQPEQVPASWSVFEWNGDRGVRAQYFVFNTRTLEGKRLIDAPHGGAVSYHAHPDLLWSPDSRRVIVVNTMLPADPHQPERVRSSYIAEYDVASGRAIPVTALPPANDGTPHPPSVEVNWGEPGRELIASWRESGKDYRFAYRKQGARWVARELAPEADSGPEPVATLQDGIEVAIRQGLNEPPRLVASLGGKELVLSGEDPVLARARLLPVEELTWTDVLDKPWKGALVLPEASAGREGLPLIIQLGEVNNERFSPDGVVMRPGHAAQTFAALGYVVLTMDDTRDTGIPTSTPDELPQFRNGVDAAVDLLVRRGLIDPARVGLIGHSRLGFRAFYIANNPEGFKPAAVAVQDSFTAGFNEYLLAMALFPRMVGIESMYSHGEPKSFWHNKQAWLESSTSFTLDRMDVPLLLLYLGETFSGPPVVGMTSFMEAWAGLRRLGKPVEGATFPGGTHNPVNPQHRAGNMQLVVDWMEYWIRGKESADPALAERNRRWQGMREVWERTKEGDAR